MESLDTAASDRERVTVVMPVYRPDPAFLRRQIESIAGQDHKSLALIAVAADCVSGELLSDELARVAIKGRILRPAAPLNAVEAFELGMAEALAEGADAGLIALSDQDDVWHGDKISASIGALRAGKAALVHCDAALVDRQERASHPSLHRAEGRLAEPGLRLRLCQNTVTGMTTLFTAELARLALPFPPGLSRLTYHDHWLALLADAVPGGVAFLDRPLVDYRQHGANAVGSSGRKPVLAPILSPEFYRTMWFRYFRSKAIAHLLVNRLTERGLSVERGTALRAIGPFLGAQWPNPSFLLECGRLAVSGQGFLAKLAFGHYFSQIWRLYRCLRISPLRPGLAGHEVDRQALAKMFGLSADELDRLDLPGRRVR